MTRSLHIAMLSVHTCPLATLGGKKTGGMNVYVRELSTELGRRGVRVDIYTRLQDSCQQHLDDHSLGDNVRVIHIPTGPEGFLTSLNLHEYIDDFADGVLEFAAEDGATYDLIHSHYWISGSLALRLKAEWGIPYLQMFHTLGRMKNRIANAENELESDIRIDVEQRIIANADTLIAATPAERIQLMWLYGADPPLISIVPPGVDLTHFCAMDPVEARQVIGLPSDASMLLFVGRIEPLKGVDTLLRAMAILRDEIGDTLYDFCLKIIGGNLEEVDETDSEIGRLVTLRDELGLHDVVSFSGAKGQEMLPYYYSAAEMLIMPSHYESFGMVALEAMACGTPVVASEVGGLAYLVQDGVTGFHVPDREPEALAAKIRQLLVDHDLRREMSEAALRTALNYAWPTVTDQIIDVYMQTVGADISA